MGSDHGSDRTGNSGAVASPCRRARLSLPLLLFLPLLLGCQANALRDRQILSPQQDPHVTLMPVSDAACTSSGELAQANAYATAAALQEQDEREGCVDLYYWAAVHAWRQLESMPAALARHPDYQTAWQIYQRSLGHLLTNAVRYGRLDPRGRLLIADGPRRQAVPIEYNGFAWRPDEFCQVLPAADFNNGDIQNYYHTRGLGVALVAVRHGCGKEMFYRSKQPFPVTAILRLRRCDERRADAHDAAANSPRGGAVLTFYNPCLFDSLHVGSAVVDIDRDLSAPFAWLLRESPRKFTEGFLDPGDADVKPKLLMMEPYQRGKVPVVLIHGLWSDPMTWADTVNELRAQRDLYRKYQFWFFRYPTGAQLLQSAAELRQKLLLARERFDPRHQDAAMEQIVLVGHSMGGLVAQLQGTYAYDILWRHAANRPLDAVRTTPDVRAQLQRMFFFDPSPLVKRIVFIGTPHHGSGMTRRLVGRVASSLVRESGSEEDQYRQLMRDNKDVFAAYLWDARPTSIELLEPSNPLLLAMSQMPFGCGVQTHSIIGDGKMALTGELSDGVVAVSSAHQTGVCSELFIPTRHDKLHRDPACVAELMRILREPTRPALAATAKNM
jgi:pimeloyl-ACP methyl ester carboxylesterase